MLSCFPIFLLGPALYFRRCRLEGISCDSPLRMMVRKIFSPFLTVNLKPSFALTFLYLLTISVPVFLLYVEAVRMGYMVDSEVHLQPNEDW